jgi:hypothetical protein
VVEFLAVKTKSTKQQKSFSVKILQAFNVVVN